MGSNGIISSSVQSSGFVMFWFTLTWFCSVFWTPPPKSLNVSFLNSIPTKENPGCFWALICKQKLIERKSQTKNEQKNKFCKKTNKHCWLNPY